MSVDKNLHRIIQRLQGKLPEEETADLNQWLSEPDNASVENELNKVWSMTGSYKAGFEPDLEKGFSRFKSSIAQTPEETPIRPIKRQSFNWRMAASIALLIGVGLAVYYSFQPGQPEMMAISTNPGEKKEIGLPDGSRVILNEDSKLIFPAQFGDQREVRLVGEAYFSVAEDPQHPFVIDCPNGHVEVLGTAFNLRAYPEEEFAEVEVESGKVMFSRPNGDDSVVLESKQMAILEPLNEGQEVVAIEAVDIPALNAQSWRTNRLDFRRLKMETIVQIIERYYGAKVELVNTEIGSCTFNSRYEREKLETVLSEIEQGFNAKLKKINKEHYQIIGGNCRTSNDQ
ncbi:MAG: FecR domain-containing protein [Saprospiraceae bacterium]|nr:FecR domain-containing protein [Saprospiraceae bacterium]